MRRSPRNAAPVFPRSIRGIAAAVIVAFAVVAVRGGAESLPWLANLAGLLEFPRGHGPRLFAGVLFSLAAMMIFAPSWSRRVAFVAAGMLVFAGVATVSGIRATRAAGPDGPGLSGLQALLVAGVAIAAVVFGAALAIRAYRASPPPSRGLSVAWRITAAFVALGGGLAIAAPAAPSRPERVAATASPPTPFAPTPPAPSPPGVESIDLDIASWADRPLAETGIEGHLPGLGARIGTDRVLLVFYNTRCGTCHELFRERFAGGTGDTSERVLAIEIPPAADAVLAAGDGLEEIECPGCERLSLPAGPRWLVRPPTVVRVEGGVVTCVDDASTGSCFVVSR